MVSGTSVPALRPPAIANHIPTGPCQVQQHLINTEDPVDFAECLAGNVEAIQAHNKAGRAWEQQDLQRRMAGRRSDMSSTPHIGTDTSWPSSHAPQNVATATPPTTEPIVHRTELCVSRGKRMRDDLAVQVCPPPLSLNLGHNQLPWDPRDLFPEICSPPTHHIEKFDLNNITKVVQVPTRNQTFPPLRPGRTTKNRIGKKKSGDETILDLNVQTFIDVPLQYAEGTEILARIDAGSIPTPSHIMLSSQQPKPNLEVGQSSKEASKKKKSSPIPHSYGPSTMQLQCQREASVNSTAAPTAHTAALTTPCDDRPTNTEDIVPHQIAADPNNLEDHLEDPNLDRVDYSDENPSF